MGREVGVLIHGRLGCEWMGGIMWSLDGLWCRRKTGCWLKV